ncbi:hypothetical protein IJD44_01165 [bacterium]|nr:hypothetical protein [bacterium]
MLKYIFDIFCKDTTVGLCHLGIYDEKNTISSQVDSSISSDYISSVFKDSISIGQIVYHL